MAVVSGWPQLHWFVTEHLSKPPKDWLPPPRPSDNAAAYIEVINAKSTSIFRMEFIWANGFRLFTCKFQNLAH